MSERPAISVVVPTFNCAPLIGAALESLAVQTFRDFEVVISDGASRDATLSVCDAYRSRLPRLVVDSRADNGIYDAINRGVGLSAGRWIYLLGADDRLHAPSTFAAFIDLVKDHDPAPREAGSAGVWPGSLVHGDVLMMNDAYGAASGTRYAGPMTLGQLLDRNFCPQAAFYRRELFQHIGGFDCRYPICADWVFHIRAAAQGAVRWIDLVVADYAAAGISASRYDERFNADRPALLRELAVRHAQRPELRSVRFRLLRDAASLMRRGRWAESLRSGASSWRLFVQAAKRETP